MIVPIHPRLLVADLESAPPPVHKWSLSVEEVCPPIVGRPWRQPSWRIWAIQSFRLVPRPHVGSPPFYLLAITPRPCSTSQSYLWTCRLRVYWLTSNRPHLVIRHRRQVGHFNCFVIDSFIFSRGSCFEESTVPCSLPQRRFGGGIGRGWQRRPWIVRVGVNCSRSWRREIANNKTCLTKVRSSKKKIIINMWSLFSGSSWCGGEKDGRHLGLW